MTEQTEQTITDASMVLGNKIIETISGADDATLFSAMTGVLLLSVADPEVADEVRKARAAFVFGRALDMADMAGLTNEQIIAIIVKRDEQKMQDMAEAVKAAGGLQIVDTGE